MGCCGRRCLSRCSPAFWLLVMRRSSAASGVTDQAICAQDRMAVTVLGRNADRMDTIDRSSVMDSETNNRKPPGPERSVSSCAGEPRAHFRSGARIAHMLDVGTHAVQATDPVGGPNAAYSSFDSVLCADDRTANDLAARRQAEMIASPDATMEFVPTSRLTRHGYRVLHDSCEGHDLLALGAGPAARTAVQHAPIPILVARTCPTGTHVTDSILVPVDASAESRCAVELAGRLAAADGQRSPSSRRRRVTPRSSGQSPRADASFSTRPARCRASSASSFHASEASHPRRSRSARRWSCSVSAAPRSSSGQRRPSSIPSDAPSSQCPAYGPMQTTRMWWGRYPNGRTPRRPEPASSTPSHRRRSPALAASPTRACSRARLRQRGHPGATPAAADDRERPGARSPRSSGRSDDRHRDHIARGLSRSLFARTGTGCVDLDEAAGLVRIAGNECAKGGPRFERVEQTLREAEVWGADDGLVARTAAR